MDLIGNELTKKQIGISMLAAKKRNTSIPHMLFSGAAGCGKTSMARYLAEKSGYPFLSVVPDELSDYTGVVKVLNQLNHDNYDDRGNRKGIVTPTILFLDEVHNTPLKGQELLGLAMERFIIESKAGQNKFIWTPRFTVIGATTMAGKLSKPFLDRFKLNFPFEPYKLDEMKEIIKLHAKQRKMILLPVAVNALAMRSRGTPRIAVRFVEMLRDRMLTLDSIMATQVLVDDMFDDLKIDEEGVTSVELKLLKTLFRAQTSVGLDSLAIAIEEDKKTIRDSLEPYLIRKGLMTVASRGRLITPKGIEYLENYGRVDKPVKKEIDFNYERT